VNEFGLPLQIELSAGQVHDAPVAELLLKDLPKGTSLLADRGYDADWIREMIEDQDCTPVIPPKSNRRDHITFSKRKYKKRNLVERCINKLKQFSHFATRYDRKASADLDFAKLAAVRLWLRF
jgi:transposase